MTYTAQVFRVLIASPGDVSEERDTAVKTIQEWNDLNSAERQLVLLPLRWETHSAPEYGKRPQEVINRQVVDQCDLLVGIFWTRIGSPTGVAASGTLEEIERVANDGKLAMLYFSKSSKNPDDIDLEQLKKLREFKQKTFPNALVENYNGIIDFRDKLSKQLEIQLRTLLASSTNRAENNNSTPYTDILFQFANVETGEAIGDQLTLNSTNLKVTDYGSIPDYQPKNTEAKSQEQRELFDLIMKTRNRDKDYYRNKVDKLIEKSKRIPVRFWLKNIGTVGARDVFLEIKLKSNKHPIILHAQRQIETSDELLIAIGDDGVKANRVSDTLWSTNIEMRALQPKREVSPARKLLLSAEEDCSIDVEANIYADTLSEPITRKLKIAYKIKTVETSYSDLLEELEE
ncbi:hypothetical protein [uncultured Thiothrix sp.]|uniref:hypothetical protein n=1 Tax=uncultured Thiothrix sp. TaxID=223185 RepID=UPI00262F0D82|nr:hypothetical protein [uncultured Thiothrix sp.]